MAGRLPRKGPRLRIGGTQLGPAPRLGVCHGPEILSWTGLDLRKSRSVQIRLLDIGPAYAIVLVEEGREGGCGGGPEYRASKSGGSSVPKTRTLWDLIFRRYSSSLSVPNGASGRRNGSHPNGGSALKPGPGDRMAFPRVSIVIPAKNE